MFRTDPEVLSRVTPLLRQLRDLKALHESGPGVFSFGGKPFVQLHTDADGLHAELRTGSHCSRYPINTPVEVRKFFDDAKRQLARITDD